MSEGTAAIRRWLGQEWSEGGAWLWGHLLMNLMWREKREMNKEDPRVWGPGNWTGDRHYCGRGERQRSRWAAAARECTAGTR